MKLNHLWMAPLFIRVETRVSECRLAFRIFTIRLHLRSVLICKLQHESAAAFTHCFGEISAMPGKIIKRSFRTIFLALKKHWSPRPQKPQPCHCPVTSGAGDVTQMLRAAKIRHLIMVLKKGDERLWGDIQRRSSAWLLLPAVILPL